MSEAVTRAPLPGSRISHFEVGEVLGTGGMSVVYRARDLQLRRTVALKFLPAWSSASEEEKQRFEREAIAASQLDHPNIASLHGIEDDGSGQKFIVMAWCEGGSLRDRLHRQAVSLSEALAFTSAVGRGLAHAHARGIVHRDIKPSNLLLNSEGAVKIVDFGLARLAGEAQLTRPGTVAGTVGYMSPEQAQGGKIDHRTDIWSLGIVLYEMVYRRLPFQDETAPAQLYSIVHRPIGFPAGAPASVERVLRKALQKDPSKRYESAADMVSDIEAAAASILPETAARTLASTIALQPIRVRSNRRRLWIGVAAAVLVVLAAALFLWRLQVRPNVPARVAVSAFRPVAQDASLETLGAGLTRWLTESLTILARHEGVVSVASSADSGSTTRVLQGSIESSSDRVRVTLNLLDRQQGGIAATRTVEAPASDPAALHSALLRAAAGMLNLDLPSSADQLAGVRDRSPEAAREYVAGLGHLEQKDKADNLDRAVQNLQNASRAAPQFALAHAALSRAYRQKYAITKETQWLERAAASASKAAAIDERFPEVLIERAAVRNAQGDQHGAVADLERALAVDPRSDAAVAELASAYEGLGVPDKAEALLVKTIEAGATSWEMHDRLGQLYYRKGRYSDAERVYRRTTELHPGDYLAWKNFGIQLARLNRHGEAEQAYRRSLEIKPDFATFNNLANVFERQQRYEEAAAMYNKALELSPKNHRVWANLASVLSRTPGGAAASEDGYRKAAQFCREALRSRPDDAYLVSNLANYLAFAGERTEPLALMRRALALAPEDVDVLMNVGETYEYLGFRKEAIEWLSKALSLNYPLAKIEGSPVLQGLTKDGRWREVTAKYRN